MTVDEELRLPPRRVGPVALTALVAAALTGAAGVIVMSSRGGDAPPPRPPATTSAATPAPAPSALTFTLADTPAAVLRAVRDAYPRAELLEVGVAVPVRADSDRNYQFLTPTQRVTVVVGRADSRPAVTTSSRRDVLVVSRRPPFRVAVSVRSLRGSVRAADVGVAVRLSRDARLLTRR